ncbi:hypothetical protein [Pseudarthrobacter sulfonivorans]|uniref:hypothetical protein n=1 Tax=Pseudarthrobacter sulfonivorans TaxID=121292 RepID=UPI0021023BC3|nr:hypothetical protein [Pseudarthrobacter sulfonivorans]
MGWSDFRDNEETRWEKAAAKSEGVADCAISGALRSYFLVYLPVGVILITGIGFGASAPLLGDFDADWPDALSIGAMLAGFGAMVGGLIYYGKRVRPLVRRQNMSVIFYLTDSENKDIRRQISGRSPVSPGLLSVVRAAAVQLRQGLAMQLHISPGFLLFYGVQVMRLCGGGISWGIRLLLSGVMACLTVAIAVQFHKTSLFLEHTAPSAR